MSGRKLFRAKSFGKKTVDDGVPAGGVTPLLWIQMVGRCCDCVVIVMWLRCIYPPAVSQEVQLGEEAAEEGVVKKRRWLDPGSRSQKNSCVGNAVSQMQELLTMWQDRTDMYCELPDGLYLEGISARELEPSSCLLRLGCLFRWVVGFSHVGWKRNPQPRKELNCWKRIGFFFCLPARWYIILLWPLWRCLHGSWAPHLWPFMPLALRSAMRCLS